MIDRRAALRGGGAVAVGAPAITAVESGSDPAFVSVVPALMGDPGRNRPAAELPEHLTRQERRSPDLGHPHKRRAGSESGNGPSALWGDGALSGATRSGPGARPGGNAAVHRGGVRAPARDGVSLGPGQRCRTAFMTLRARGAPSRPPEMSSREIFMSVGSMNTATATEAPSGFLP